MPDVREVYEMVTKEKPSDPGGLERQHTRQIRTMRNRKIGAFAVTSAIGLVAVAVALGSGGGPNMPVPSADPATNRVDATADEAVAIGFLEAYRVLDAGRAITYLSDDADVSGLVSSLGAQGTEGTREELPLFFSLLEGMGYQQALVSCEETGHSGSDTDIRCTFAFHLLGSDAFGRGLFRGSYFDLTVRGGKIVRASQTWNTERFSAQMWVPFAGWLSRSHPDDAAVMYGDPSYSGARLTEESVRLWKQRTREYVSEVGSIESAPADGWLSRVVDGVPLSLRVPDAAWTQFGQTSINKSIMGPQGAEAMVFWSSFPDGEYANPCASLSSQPSGTSAADLAHAVSTAPGTELVAGPSDVTVGGLQAQHVVLSVREDVGCDPGYFYTWPDVRWGALWPGTTVGDTIQLWIVDVDGTTLFIEAETTEQADIDLEREIKQIIGSIRFG